MQQLPKESSPGDESVSHSEPAQSHEEILEYWTPARLAEAKPRELRLPEEGSAPQAAGRGSSTRES
ncbi:MAG TPA: hypothetical protein VIQ52_20350 [Arthrobacter sp.]